MNGKTKRAFKSRLFGEFARIGKAFSSPHRLQLIEVLAQGERTVEQRRRLGAGFGIDAENRRPRFRFPLVGKTPGNLAAFLVRTGRRDAHTDGIDDMPKCRLPHLIRPIDHVLRPLRAQAPERFRWRTERYEFVEHLPAIDLLTGSGAFRAAVERGDSTEALCAAWEPERQSYLARRSSALLY